MAKKTSKSSAKTTKAASARSPKAGADLQKNVK